MLVVLSGDISSAHSLSCNEISSWFCLVFGSAGICVKSTFDPREEDRIPQNICPLRITKLPNLEMNIPHLMHCLDLILLS